ncbi:hypothetical protein D5B42_23325 [Salmonella enterica subsp. enterica serovar Oranienburg]|nr:hypothetical protein [Salmonella enterica subsp. enterica serovar Oranienburg]
MIHYKQLLNLVRGTFHKETSLWDHTASFIEYDSSSFIELYLQEDSTLALIIEDGREYPEDLTEANIVATNLHEKLLNDLGFYD